MSNPIADTRALIKMGTAQRLLARQLAKLVLDNPQSTPAEVRIATAIAYPQPECQQALQQQQREVA
jgi:hypothetical protein